MNGKLYWLVFVMAAATGCKREVVMAFHPDIHTMVVKVKGGDVITFEQPVTWVGGSPCEKDDPNTCTIKTVLKGNKYSFKCQNGDCDPEILIDESRDLHQTDFTPRAAGDTYVTMVCDANGKASQSEPGIPLEVNKDANIQWHVTGDYSKADWSLDITVLADFCTVNTPVTKSNPTCKVKSGARSATYAITIDGCNKSDDIAITVR